MKKIFSILAAVLFAGSMMATEVVFTNADFAGQGTANTGSEVTATKDGVTFTFSKGYSATESLRCYAHGALTISAESTIEKINFTTTGGKTGGLEAEVTVGATTYSVEDLASQARFTEIKVTLGGEVPPTPSINYYVAGSMNSWTANPAYKLTANPNAEGEYMGEFTFAANDEFKVIMDNGSETYTWYPDGMDNNYVITEAGDYAVYFRPAGNVEGWYEGFFYVEKAEPVMPDTLSCAQAREAALGGMTDEVIVRGYVTEIVSAWSAQYKNVSFWMADTQDGGKVFEAYRVACENKADAPGVGDLVWVKGELTKYNTTPETKQGGTFGIIEKSQIVPQNLGSKTIEEFLALKNTIDTCVLTGVVDSIINDQYGNLYLSDATAQVYVYGVLTADGQSKKFAELGVEAGDELTVLALYNEHNNKPQVKNAIFVSVKKNPTAISNTAVEGKAVKALVNGQVLIIKNGKTYNVLGTRVR